MATKLMRSAVAWIGLVLAMGSLSGCGVRRETHVVIEPSYSYIAAAHTAGDGIAAARLDDGRVAAVALRGSANAE